MGFFDRFRKKDLDQKIREALFHYIGGHPISYEDNKTSYIRNGYQSNLFVYLCVNYITNKASDIPLYLCDRDGERIDDVNIQRLLDKPNDLQSFREFVEQSLGFYLLTGNTFVYKQSPTGGANQGKPLQIYNLPSQYMEIIAGKTISSPIDGYVMNTISQAEFKPEEVMHIRTPNYDYNEGEWLYGQSPIRAGLSTINLSNSVNTAMTAQSQNLGAKGMLMWDSMGNNTSPLTADQLRGVEDTIERKISGDANRGRIALTNHVFKYQQLGLSSADLQLLEDHKVSRQDICAMYGLSSMLFNDDTNSTFNNVQEAKKSAYTDAILPNLENFLAKFNEEIIKVWNEDVMLKADYNAIEVLKKDRTTMIATLNNAWYIPTSQKQKMVGVEADEVLDEYYLPMNLIPTGSESVDLEKVSDLYNDYGKKELVQGMTDVFTTRQEAEARAEEMGGSGYHVHNFDGQRVYMPFETHEDYEDAKGGHEEEERRYKEITNFPTRGEDKKISLRNSNYPQFDYEFAKTNKEQHPKIWKAGGNIRGNEAFNLWGKARDGEETNAVLSWIKEREAWMARHFEDGSQFEDPDTSPNLSNIGGVVAQMKWGGIGTLGEQGMKDVILEVTKKLEGKKDVKPEVTDRVETALQNKIDEHNDKVGDDPTKRATMPMLKEVFVRGIGAYETNPESVRPNVGSPDQWAYARVNSFLFALDKGRFQGGKHDTDLLPKGHPESTKE